MTGAPPSRATQTSQRTSVRRLTVTDFRNYSHARLDTDARSVVLTGPNGAGKTNLLEALSLLVPGRGLRRVAPGEPARMEPGAQDKRHPWAVAARLQTAHGETDVGSGLAPSPAPGVRDKRLVRIDGEAARAQSALSEVWSAQWLTPQMDRLFSEGSGGRRRFLDRLVFAADPAHAGRVSAYDHALRERGKLLRAAREGAVADEAWLGALEETLATKGVAVAAARLQTVQRLNAVCAQPFGPFPGADLALGGALERWLEDGPALAAEDAMRDTLTRDRRRDQETGGASVGPHRTDLLVTHCPKGVAAAQCSTGEQKALLIAIVLASARLGAADRGMTPVLLLDEVAAHLDEARRDALFSAIEDMGAQAWMTGTERGLFSSLESRAQFFSVEDGAVRALG